jgi:hypothetical protein
VNKYVIRSLFFCVLYRVLYTEFDPALVENVSYDTRLKSETATFNTAGFKTPHKYYYHTPNGLQSYKYSSDIATMTERG